MLIKKLQSENEILERIDLIEENENTINQFTSLEEDKTLDQTLVCLNILKDDCVKSKTEYSIQMAMKSDRKYVRMFDFYNIKLNKIKSTINLVEGKLALESFK